MGRGESPAGNSTIGIGILKGGYYCRCRKMIEEGKNKQDIIKI